MEVNKQVEGYSLGVILGMPLALRIEVKEFVQALPRLRRSRTSGSYILYRLLKGILTGAGGNNGILMVSPPVILASCTKPEFVLRIRLEILK